MKKQQQKRNNGIGVFQLSSPNFLSPNPPFMKQELNFIQDDLEFIL